jgi:hypothetical protein
MAPPTPYCGCCDQWTPGKAFGFQTAFGKSEQSKLVSLSLLFLLCGGNVKVMEAAVSAGQHD